MKLISGSTREIRNIFVLLGDKENGMTFSLGWVLSRSEKFLGALLKNLTGETFGSVADAVVRLQTGRAGAGITDVEVDVGMDIAVIFEAKRGGAPPGQAQ